MLKLMRRIGEKIVINKEIVISIESVRGSQFSFCIEAPKGVEIDREEIFKKKYPEDQG